MDKDSSARYGKGRHLDEVIPIFLPWEHFVLYKVHYDAIPSHAVLPDLIKVSYLSRVKLISPFPINARSLLTIVAYHNPKGTTFWTSPTHRILQLLQSHCRAYPDSAKVVLTSLFCTRELMHHPIMSQYHLVLFENCVLRNLFLCWNDGMEWNPMSLILILCLLVRQFLAS